MTTRKDSIDGDQSGETGSNPREGLKSPAPIIGSAADTARDQSMLGRENSVCAREELSLTREGIADQRDRLAQTREKVARIRERSVDLRERSARSREEALHEAAMLKELLEKHADKLRQANEQLVITAVQAQTMLEELQQAKDQMDHMAHHDFLTDLPNRVLFKERLAQAMALAKRHKTKLAILFIDLDRFKKINDSLGHAVGDILLQAVAQRLTAAIRSTDTVSRQGGDEFLVLLSEVTNEAGISAFAEKICAAVTAPYRLAGQDLHIGVTIGISLYPDDGEDPDKLIQNADVAMYHAKHSSLDRYHFFRPELNTLVVERQLIESGLRQALEQQEFELLYQPKVNLDSGMITGAEALLRWIHPAWGTMLPERFVPIAEDCGLIVPIGRWVLREACAQAKRWQDAGLKPVSIAVNISALEFRSTGFVDTVRAILDEVGLAPGCLQLEITESVLMSNARASNELLQQLKSMGVQLAVDDFGTGYSSLSYLTQFPIDVLKIDSSFVHDIGSPSDDGIIVSAVINMGTSLKQRVIAEGVEIAEQLAFLKAQHCEEGQGFLFSKPLPAEQFAEMLATKTRKGRHMLPA